MSPKKERKAAFDEARKSAFFPIVNVDSSRAVNVILDSFFFFFLCFEGLLCNSDDDKRTNEELQEGIKNGGGLLRKNQTMHLMTKHG